MSYSDEYVNYEVYALKYVKSAKLARVPGMSFVELQCLHVLLLLDASSTEPIGPKRIAFVYTNEL